jgi:mono/diheme cytochrome c family protein
MRRLLRLRPRLWFVTAALLLLVMVAFYHYEARGELSPVARGEQLAQAQGCFACHGRSEEEPRANFRRTPSGTWRAKPVPTFWQNGIDSVDVLVDWIAHGCPPGEKERHQQLFVQMPAYDGLLARSDQEAIAAWILAQSLPRLLGHGGEAEKSGDAEGERSVEALLRGGDQLSRQHGCYQCHGELGQGGVPNPSSFKGYIPGFFGADFRALTANGNRAEILHWIEHGRGRAIEAGPLGRFATFFVDRQRIGMPAYGDRLTAAEKTLFVDYLLHLNARGPLSAQDVEQMVRQLAGD